VGARGAARLARRASQFANERANAGENSMGVDLYFDVYPEDALHAECTRRMDAQDA
jgi:hypothetical protein